MLVATPLALSFYYSFTNRNLLAPRAEFVGVDNYARLLTDANFLGGFAFTSVLTVINLVLVNVVGLGIALLLNKVGRTYFAMRMIIFVPVVLSGVIVAFIWSRILTDRGVLNTALRATGLGDWTLGWKTPAEAFNEQLLLAQQASVATTG